MIPAEAVEAAARAIDESAAEGCGCCANPQFTPEDDKLADSLSISVRALLIAREALEAAASYMLAEAFNYGWREGAGIPSPVNLDTGEPMHDQAMQPSWNPYRPTP